MSHVSKTTVWTCIAVFVAGIIAGTIVCLQASPVPEPRVPGSNAVPAHVVLAVLALAVALALPRTRLGRRAPYPVWFAPFSTSALDRLRRTVLPGSVGATSRVNPVRVVLAVCLTLLLLFNLFRAGVQVVGGLDPNFTVNAWGGPTYLGAMLAHYLDGLILFYAEAFLLDVVMVQAANEGARSISERAS